MAVFMQRAFPVLLLSALLCHGAVPAVPQPLPTPADSCNAAAWLDTATDANGNSLLLTLCRTAALTDRESALYLHPFITELLRRGADPLAENEDGCNAVFYLCGMPELYAELKKQKLIPRELALRLPSEESAQLLYMKRRTAQTALAPAVGSRDYLVRRYCAPFYDRAEKSLRQYLKAEGLYKLPDEALTTSLAFMRVADAQRAHAFVNNLPLWQHGEHFLEELPAEFLHSLVQLGWQVNPGKLRLALQKLNSMLPDRQDDMIDCSAADPMEHLLELLVNQEGKRALPDLQKYAASYDPELVQAVLRLELKLNGITPPDELDEEPQDADTAALREVLLADSALHRGSLEGLNAANLMRVADYLEREGLKEHAEIFRSMVEEDEMIATETSMPAIRAAYDDLNEERPRVRLLRKLLPQAPAARP